MGKDRRLFCILAGQRSGTTALRSLMSMTGAFTDLGEPFDTAIRDKPHSFFGYCERQNRGLLDMLTGEQTAAFSRDYVEYLWSLATTDHMVIDIKHNSWGNIRFAWAFQHQEPFFLGHLKRQRARFLFLWRRDMIGQMLSDRIAARLGTWHNIRVEKNVEPFSLDVAELAERTRLMCLAEGFYYGLLKEYPFARTFCYEELFDEDNCLMPAIREAVCELAGSTFEFPDRALYRRNEVDKRKIVANYEEIEQVLGAIIGEYRSAFLAQVNA